MLRDIRRGKDATLALTEAFSASSERFDGSLFSAAAIRYYYAALYRDMAAGEQDDYVQEQKTTLLDLMGLNEKYTARCPEAENFYLRQAFKTAGQHFSVFEEETTDILVPYEEGRRLLAELDSERASIGRVLSRSGPEKTESIYGQRISISEKVAGKGTGADPSLRRMCSGAGRGIL